MRAWVYLLGTALLAGALVTPALIVMVLGGGSFDDALFVVLAALMIVSALAVVTLRDIIRCGLAMIVCFSGGASSSPVSRVASERCDDVCSMNPSMPDRRLIGSVPAVEVPAADAGGKEST